MKITYAQALQALKQISTTSQNGQEVKTDLARAKGDTGLLVYHLRHDIKEAFKAHADQGETIREQYMELERERQEIGKEDIKPKDIKRLDIKRLEKIAKEMESLDAQYSELLTKEEEVKLTKGKLKVNDVKQYIDSDGYEALDFAIEF